MEVVAPLVVVVALLLVVVLLVVVGVALLVVVVLCWWWWLHCCWWFLFCCWWWCSLFIFKILSKKEVVGTCIWLLPAANFFFKVLFIFCHTCNPYTYDQRSRFQ